jgi:small subunit ribosomal protein S1
MTDETMDAPADGVKPEEAEAAPEETAAEETPAIDEVQEALTAAAQPAVTDATDDRDDAAPLGEAATEPEAASAAPAQEEAAPAAAPAEGSEAATPEPVAVTDEQAVAEQPADEQAVAEQPTDEQAVAEQPTDEQAVAEQPTDEQAVAAEAPAPARRPKREVVVTDPARALEGIGDLPSDMSAEDFAAAIEKTVVELGEGSLVTGRVVRVDPDEVLVDIGYKSEGVIPSKELSIRNTVNPNDVVTVGDEIEALVLQMEDQEGRLILSKKRAQYERAWGRIETVMEEGGTVTGQVIEVVKGGLILDIGLRGFLPASLVELRRVRDLHPYVGETLEAKVIELDKNRNNVVLSRRAYLEEEQAEQRHAFLDELSQGEIRDGVVSSVVNFGAFVDLGGMDGLVHVSELSWQHVSHPSEIVSVGDKVKVRVLEVDRDRERISLSIRQTSADPWESFSEAHEVGDVVDGSVTKTVPFGAFVSVTDGVEGLVHVSEIAVHHVESPELELSVGQPVKVKITEIDGDRRRISLSIKQASPEWEERSQWQEERRPRRRPQRREFVREEEREPEPSFSADASLEAILQELKEKGIGRK